MTLKFPAVAAALACCLSCIEVNPKLGGNFIPLDQTYSIFPTDTLIPASILSQKFADSLSGYSQTRITLGAIRDSENGYELSTRASAFALIPPYDTMDFGNKSALVYKGFHFASAYDTVSVSKFGQEYILQNVEVFALEQALDPGRDYDCNNKAGTVKVNFSKKINKGNPVLNGKDSLSFDFIDDYGRSFLEITQEDLEDYDRFVSKYPGIYLRTNNPMGEGGRINMMECQLGYDSNYGYVLGDYAEFKFKGDYDYDGIPETDTAFFFCFGFTRFLDLDSLLENGTHGSYPQYALNITTQTTREKAGPVSEKILIEGGGGLKPVISAIGLKHLAEELIARKGGNPKTAVINKAKLIFPFEFPSDYRQMYKFPEMLSPTCRIKNDSIIVYSGLTDSSSSDENQGDINRSKLCYEPDVTYHVQELLKINESPIEGETETQKAKRSKLLNGEYDIWLLNMAYELEEEESSSNSELSEYYQYLAYQSYYSSMYGGYSSYNSYGDSYTNYYNYMMMANYASSSTISTSYENMLDIHRYYCSCLNGPVGHPRNRSPRLELTFSLSNE